MIRHTLLLIYRNFNRFRGTFLINLVGLSTGLCCTLLIYLWVNDEWHVDKFHENDDRLFQVMVNDENEDGIHTTGVTPGILAAALKDELPEVEYAASSYTTFLDGKITLSEGEKSVQGDGLYASKDYLNVFSYPLIQGDKNQVLADKKAIVVSKAIALNLFNSAENAVGKIIEWNREKEFVVTGVFEGTGDNSSTRFDFLISYDVLLEQHPNLKEWSSSDPNTYLVLKKGTDVDHFNMKINGFLKSKRNGSKSTLFARRYSEGYLLDHFENGVPSGGRIEYVRLFSIIAAFILVIACINFMNLSTAKASRRIKEIGVKKAIGAHRRTLIFQYLGESMLMSFLSLFIAMLMTDLCMSSFNDITGKHLALHYNPGFIVSTLSIASITGMIAGSYPAFYLSGFKPAVVLKGKLTSTPGGLWARNGLVVFQFVITIIFIVSVLVVHEQIEYVQNKKLGYNKDNILSFQMAGSIEDILHNREPMLAEIRNAPGVISVSSMDHSSMVADFGTTGADWQGRDPNNETQFQNIGVNYGLIETLGIEIAEGRSFSREKSSDSAEVIFNEAAVAAMGMTDPVGKVVNIWGVDRKIAGVVKNFHIESLHENIKPFLFRLEPQYTHCIMVKVKAGAEQEAIETLQREFQKFNPGFVFNYKFIDEDFQALYAAEKRVSILSQYFAALAILISCLGLFGLASFTAERRNKEIGIRKILGSGEWGIVYLLSRDFTKIVFAAIVIALPLSYWMTRLWLDSFVFKITLSFWYFAGAGLIALGIAWLTVGGQAFKAARINPVRCLKEE